MWDFLTFNTFVTKNILIIMIFFLFCIEIFLRMFFEMLIGYFDMHDYLYKILQKG